LSIVIIPLAMELIHRAAGQRLSMSPALVGKRMLLGVLVPLAAGMVVRRLAGARADGAARLISNTAFLILVACVAIVLIAARRALGSLIGSGTILAIAAFVAAGLAAGHLLGGRDLERRGVLAIATSLRHPGIAVAIAQANFPNEKRAVASVLLCTLVGLVVSVPYQLWLNSRRARAAEPCGRTTSSLRAATGRKRCASAADYRQGCDTQGGRFDARQARHAKEIDDERGLDCRTTGLQISALQIGEREFQSSGRNAIVDQRCGKLTDWVVPTRKWSST
jgi:hypothetical protein